MSGIGSSGQRLEDRGKRPEVGGHRLKEEGEMVGTGGKASEVDKEEPVLLRGTGEIFQIPGA